LPEACAGADVYTGTCSRLAKFARAVPARRWNRKAVHEPPDELANATLSGELTASGLRALDANSAEGRAYLNDAIWARNYAAANRRQIAVNIAAIMATTLGATLQWEQAIVSDHNHVESELHFGTSLWVHRKGAMAATEGQWGALPGSMGAVSFHVQGRGCAEALCSSAHGAGRLMSRTAARQKVSTRELQRQMTGIWYDYRLVDRLRDEAPSAYKDIRAVARAQRELVKISRVLRPVLNYKGV